MDGDVKFISFLLEKICGLRESDGGFGVSGIFPWGDGGFGGFGNFSWGLEYEFPR